MSGKHRIMVSNSIHDGQMLVYRRWKASHSKYPDGSENYDFSKSTFAKK